MRTGRGERRIGGDDRVGQGLGSVPYVGWIKANAVE
jgi:hypothetical protein